jgi:hypothetical protein
LLSAKNDLSFVPDNHKYFIVKPINPLKMSAETKVSEISITKAIVLLVIGIVVAVGVSNYLKSHTTLLGAPAA